MRKKCRFPADVPRRVPVSSRLKEAPEGSVQSLHSPLLSGLSGSAKSPTGRASLRLNSTLLQMLQQRGRSRVSVGLFRSSLLLCSLQTWSFDTPRRALAGKWRVAKLPLRTQPAPPARTGETNSMTFAFALKWIVVEYSLPPGMLSTDYTRRVEKVWEKASERIRDNEV